MIYIPLHYAPCELLPGVARGVDWTTLRPHALCHFFPCFLVF